MWFLIIFFIAIIAYLIWGVHYNINEINKKKQEKSNIKEAGNKYGAQYSTKINHICGLLLAENSECIIHLCENQIIIEGTSNIFKLNREKILDMNIKTSKEVQNSISGAVGGYILLGPIGAFIGGSTTDFHRFFIIIYQGKENEKQCISFDMKDNLEALKEINMYINIFKSDKENKKEIEL